ncbi:acyltransferase [Undibacterium sp. TS12]|uniref:acyltransferase family protein n=1 Tax=Undibacterium sp. TS12 TaxID=2908202 RepID=UPI001F4C9EAB|nr:acyltransferase [Undibacterium sp. TS12]MCH8621177.1 acyltransferase [Undibacterium sp. TS12]
MRLSDFTASRDNNFNLIRITAAMAVMINHCFPLTGQTEPFHHNLGMTIGSIAVDVFFIASGFLVTGSLIRCDNVMEYLVCRGLRIFPGLIVMTFLSVFLLGPFFTALSCQAYLLDSSTYTYLLRNSSLLFGIDYVLPGVFETNPYKKAVNGSLWTLLYELKMYWLLLFIWWLCKPRPKAGDEKSPDKHLGMPQLVICLVTGAAIYLAIGQGTARSHLTQFIFMFFSGTFFYLMKGRIVFSHGLFLAGTTALIIAGLLSARWFALAYYLFVAYLLLYLAFVPTGKIRAINKLGDYSYGVYIYAFPVQQALVAMYPGISILNMACWSTLITLLFAAASWHIIEQPSLQKKTVILSGLKKLFRVRQAS